MDQKAFWNAIHIKGKQDVYAETQTEFATEVAGYLFPQAAVVDLGCGLGMDADFFAQQGHAVTAIDVSDFVVTKNRQKYAKTPNLTFQVVDMAKGELPFAAHSFDAVYARLALHYYTDQITKELFKEIYRILTPNGILAFTCKSVDDPTYGKGERLEKDFYSNNGHIRHFFTEDYARSLLANFQIEKLESQKGDLYGDPSAYITVIAKKV